MLDPKVIELVDRIVRVQFEECETQLQRDILITQNQAAMRGMGTSSALVEQVYDLCARDIEIRTLIVWQNFLRVLSQTVIVPSEGLAQDLKRVVQNYQSSIYFYPAESLERVTRTTGFGTRRPLGDAWEKAARKIEAEIDVFALSLRRRAEAIDRQAGSPQPVFHIYSAVGAIQTGPSATANVVQTLLPQDREALIKALDLTKHAISTLDELPSNPKEEVIELVEEAKSEATKSTPNQTRLRAILTTVASAIQTVGSLQPAYQAVKTALLPLGISLP